MTRQILAILIVVAILAVMVRVFLQWSGTPLSTGGQDVTPTAVVVVVAPATDTQPTALPQSLATAVVATVQAVRGTATPLVSSGKPNSFPDTGIAETVTWSERAPFLVFITGITAVTVVGMWLGRKR